MKKTEILELFGSEYAVSKFFGITHQSVNQWPDDVPLLRVYQLKERMHEVLDFVSSRRGRGRPKLLRKPAADVRPENDGVRPNALDTSADPVLPYDSNSKSANNDLL